MALSRRNSLASEYSLCGFDDEDDLLECLGVDDDVLTLNGEEFPDRDEDRWSVGNSKSPIIDCETQTANTFDKNAQELTSSSTGYILHGNPSLLKNSINLQPTENIEFVQEMDTASVEHHEVHIPQVCPRFNTSAYGTSPILSTKNLTQNKNHSKLSPQEYLNALKNLETSMRRSQATRISLLMKPLL